MTDWKDCVEFQIVIEGARHDCILTGDGTYGCVHGYHESHAAFMEALARVLDVQGPLLAALEKS